MEHAQRILEFDYFGHKPFAFYSWGEILVAVVMAPKLIPIQVYLFVRLTNSLSFEANEDMGETWSHSPNAANSQKCHFCHHRWLPCEEYGEYEVRKAGDGRLDQIGDMLTWILV